VLGGGGGAGVGLFLGVLRSAAPYPGHLEVPMGSGKHPRTEEKRGKNLNDVWPPAATKATPCRREKSAPDGKNRLFSENRQNGAIDAGGGGGWEGGGGGGGELNRTPKKKPVKRERRVGPITHGV